MGLLDIFTGKKRWRYTQEEAQTLENYIESAFGPIGSVLHEIVSPDIHLDIAVIPPTETLPFMKLVTMGMGAREMTIPANFRGQELERVELVQFLPSDWNIESKEEQFYWPIRNMKFLGRFPFERKTWLSCGHTIATREGEPFAPDTKLNGSILLNIMLGTDVIKVRLPSDKLINFHAIVPLYPEEMEFKLSHSTDELLQQFEKSQVSLVLDKNRKNSCI